MQRRNFIKNTALCAVAVSASGFIRFDGNNYVGDCETTTDIIGPFYRPNSPVRNNFVIPGKAGQLVELSGVIKHKDCVTPYANAKIELWHCDNEGVYDNDSDEFRYRGTSFSDEKGNYAFHTIFPVAYDIGNGFTRPAHFHMMITAEGYQPLVTQLYFTGDKYISKDISASLPQAKRRILNLQTLSNGDKKVNFDVSMSEKLAADPAAVARFAGEYTSDKAPERKIVLFKKNDELWLQNDVYGVNYDYAGNNTFYYAGMAPGTDDSLQFKIMPDGVIELTATFLSMDGGKKIVVARKK